MPNPDAERQSWPPPPTALVPPPVVVPTRLPRGLKIGMVAALMSCLFSTWEHMRFVPHRYSILRYLPDTRSQMIWLKGGWFILGSGYLLAVLFIASIGLGICWLDYRRDRRITKSRTGWMPLLAVALNIMPFALYVYLFVHHGGNIAVQYLMP